MTAPASIGHALRLWSLPIALGLLLSHPHSAGAAGDAGQDSTDCRLPSTHAGLSLSLDEISPDWRCRLAPTVTNYTTANKIGPVTTALPARFFYYLLDHPPVAAALVNRLELGLHRAEWRGERFWLTDGEGTAGVVQLVHEARSGDQAVRLYYVEGTHDGRWLPAVSGTAVVMLWMRPVQTSTGPGAMETTMVAYVRMNSRFLSGLLTLLRPLVGRVVMQQVGKAFKTAGAFARLARTEPERVLAEAVDPPPLDDEAVRTVRMELAALREEGRSQPLLVPMVPQP